ncbi:Pyruvate decarboxylase 1 [Castilleja foliolosa]|uniref:Pyruvate decarboxylase 1 n=1 Tax=Castilleja foliolosa TaxID=1961234 RepID=A0ABD3ECB7_9LAMI
MGPEKRVLTCIGYGSFQVYGVVVKNLEDAHELIDTGISTSMALKGSKVVYISVSCDLPSITHPTFRRDPVPFVLSPKLIFTSRLIVLC